MKTALVLFAEGTEELEAVSIVNILRRGDVSVTLAGLIDGVLQGSRGIKIMPDTTLDEALTHDYDMIVLPGGQPGTNNLKADVRVIQLLQKMAADGRYVCAICAAPSVLASAGLLDGKRATSYPCALDEFPNVQQQTTAIVEDAHLITSRGPGTAIDFSLTLLERLTGKAKREEVEAALVR
jgi:4-methyl-5(b-hydroxyethyl)-thiazole monophosphate biosynthesis